MSGEGLQHTEREDCYQSTYWRMVDGQLTPACSLSADRVEITILGSHYFPKFVFALPEEKSKANELRRMLTMAFQRGKAERSSEFCKLLGLR
jgi:hypothetical protein